MNPYEILGVMPNADAEAIKGAWRKLARIWHPDRQGGNDRRMGEINAAYALLTDPILRERYDLTGETDGPAALPIDVEAKACLMQILAAGLTNDFDVGDIGQWLMKNVEHNISHSLNSVATMDAKITRIRKKRGSSKMTEMGETLLGGVFDQLIDGYTQSRDKSQKTLDTMKRAKEILVELIEFQKNLPNTKLDAFEKDSIIMQFLEGKTQFGPGPL